MRKQTLRLRSGHEGFTLIELLVVIAIIGLLSTLAVVALTSARGKARDAKRISDIKQIQTALELYFADQGQKYPAQATSALVLGTGNGSVICGGSTGGIKDALGNCGTSPVTFMGKVPRDPQFTGTPGTACASDSSVACEYGYAVSDGTKYEIWFRLEGATGELQAGMNCGSPNGIKSGSCP